MNQRDGIQLAGRHVHFVGIGGCGMSGLARIVRAGGASVTGSDMNRSAVTDALQSEGVAVVLEQTAESLPADCDLVVISAAVKWDHPEVLAAEKRGVEVIKYAAMLGRLMTDRVGVAVAGTHGKSTTTAMLAHVLIETGYDPTFIVGATCEQIGGGARVGRPDGLIAEACEYDRSFHNFQPTHAAILNVEEDHLDIYGDLDGVIEAFHHFARLVHPGGSLLIHHGRAYRTRIAAGLPCDVHTFGYSPEADWTIKKVSGTVSAGDEKVPDTFSVGRGREVVCRFACRLPGEHMAANAAAAGILAHQLGGDWDGIGEALSSFRGLDRRMQHLGSPGGVAVIDDYGHHPTEIDATLRALRDHHLREEGDGAGRLLCVFQPHQHSRTRFLLEQFASSFSTADLVIVPHIYFVRDSEEDRRAVSAADLVRALRQRGVRALHIDAFDEIVAHLRGECRPGDLLVVMGAGPVWQVAHQFIAAAQ